MVPKDNQNNSNDDDSRLDAAPVAEQFFPLAQAGSRILKLVDKTIQKRGYTADNTLFAQSVCPDEINHEEGDITNLFSEYLGEVFHLGGLAGIPFTGKTGFAAFSHHVPDDGHCFVLMAPHIGISDSLQLGQYSRDFQTHDGKACGAAVGALQHCCRSGNNDIADPSQTPEDYQMQYIIQQVSKRSEALANIADENEKQAALARVVWTIGKEMLDKIISTDFGSAQSKLVVFTGIQINMPRPHEDFFQPLTFVEYTKDGLTTDLFEESFGAQSLYTNKSET